MTFDRVPREFTRAVLSSLGDQLQKVKFRDQSQIDPFQLLQFPQLEKLIIGAYCEVNPLTPGNPLDFDCFLPKIEEIYSGSCFGPWSFLFEMGTKSSLTRLDLMCSHFGNPESLLHMQWEDIPDLWPNLQKLRLLRVEGLTLEKLLDIIPRLPFLEELLLPNNLLKPEEIHQLTKKLSSPSPISFDFASPQDEDCLYCQQESDDEDAEDSQDADSDDEDSD